MYSGRISPTFRKNMLLPSSGRYNQQDAGSKQSHLDYTIDIRVQLSSLEFVHYISRRELFKHPLKERNRANTILGVNSSPGRGKNFLFSNSSRPALGSTQRPTQWVPAPLSQGVKRPVREADRSPPTRAEVKRILIYTSTPPHAFMA
jgi:hypothetical protein